VTLIERALTYQTIIQREIVEKMKSR